MVTKQLAALLAITISWLQIPVSAQTYSSFYKKSESSFTTIENSFNTPNASLAIDSSMSPKSDRSSYVDRILEVNQLNNASRFAGNKTAVLGTKSINPNSSEHPSFLKESVRTTRNKCFATQAGNSNCNWFLIIPFYSLMAQHTQNRRAHS